MFERLIANQVNSFMQPKLSKHLCGFRKSHGVQHALLNMIRNWQKCLNNSEKIGAVLMDLSKAFDCLPHDLLIAKLQAYGFSMNSVRFLSSYLRSRKQRVKLGCTFSDWLKVLSGVPQGSVLGPILFNIFLNDIFYISLSSTICNFADDNTLYVSDETLDGVLRQLKLDIDNVSTWFDRNAMVVNPEKFQLIIPRHRSDSVSLKIGSVEISNTDTVKLFCVIIDSKLSFNPHVKEICKKVSQKTRALARVRHYLSQTKTNLLFASYILSYFNYCPLVWMFCDKSSHRLLTSTYRRALAIKHVNFSLDDHNFLQILNIESLHQRCLRY